MNKYLLFFVLLLFSCSNKEKVVTTIKSDIKEKVVIEPELQFAQIDLNNRNDSRLIEIIDEFLYNIQSQETKLNKAIIDSFPSAKNNYLIDRLFDQSMHFKNHELIDYFLDKGYQPSFHNIGVLAAPYGKDTVLFKNEMYNRIKSKEIFYFHSLSKCNLTQLEFLLQNERSDFDFMVSYYEEDKVHLACLASSCSEQFVEILDILVSHGMKIDEQQYDCILESNSPGIPNFLSIAIIDKLLDKGIFKESSSWTPLTSTALWNDNKVLAFFLSKGYNPNLNDCSEILYQAAIRPGDGFGEHILPEKNLEAIKVLLSYGANPDLPMCSDDEEFQGKTFREYLTSRLSELNSNILKLLQ